MASQFFTVKGQKPKYNYTDAINAQTPFLPARYQAAANRKQSDKEFRATSDFQADQLNLAEKGLKQQKKDARIANIIGVGNLGVQSYLAGEALTSGPGGTGGEAAKAAKATVGTTPGGIISKAGDFLKPNQSLSDLKFGGLKGGFTPTNLLLGGGAGLVAGSLLGKKKKGRSTAIGAGAGAISSYLGSGGDLYKTAVGALSGGGGGLLSSFF